MKRFLLALAAFAMLGSAVAEAQIASSRLGRRASLESRLPDSVVRALPKGAVVTKVEGNRFTYRVPGNVRLAQYQPGIQTQQYVPETAPPVPVDEPLAEEVETADAEPAADVQVETRQISAQSRRSLLRLAIQGRINKLPRNAREERNFLNRFLGDDDLLTLANEMADLEDPPVVTDPKDPFGTRIQWLIDHMDEIIAMIKKIMALFEGLNPPVAVWEPVNGGYVHAWNDAGVVRFELLRRAA